VADLDCQERKVIQVTEEHVAFLVILVRKVIEDSLAYLACLASREMLVNQDPLEDLVITSQNSCRRCKNAYSVK